MSRVVSTASASSASKYLHIVGPSVLRGRPRPRVAHLVEGPAFPLLDLGLAVGAPSGRLVEVARTAVRLEDPQDRRAVAERAKCVFSLTKERAADPLVPRRRMEVDRVELADRRIHRRMRRTHVDEAHDLAVALGHEGTQTIVGEHLAPDPVATPTRRIQAVEDLVGDLAAIRRSPGRD